MERIYNFYTLSATCDESNIRYVGVTTKTVKLRFYGHKYCALHSEKRGLPVHKWMYSHYEIGEDIIVKLIDSCLENEWEEKEKYWVKYYKDLGYDLLNISEGGNGVITKEMRSISSIQRSINGHKKPVVALNKDGSFYKRYDSVKDATEELGLKSKSAIQNALSGRSKSAGGYMWVYENVYDPNKSYTYRKDSRGLSIYRFDIDGVLLEEYPSKRFFDKIEGWSFNGIQTAIREKKVYHDSYWGMTKTINIEEYEPYFYYQEKDNNGEVVEYYRTQFEICDKFDMSPSLVCTKIKNESVFPNGNKICKI